MSNESGLGEDGSLSVEVDCEVTTFNRQGEESIETTLAKIDSFSDRDMARSKQTLRKSGQDYNKYRHVRFGKPGGKASQYLRVCQEDDDGSTSSSSSNSDTSEAKVAANQGNPVVRQAIQAGRRRRQVVGGKVRVFQRSPTKNPDGCRCYRLKPGVLALKEIAYYQKEYGLICSKAAASRLFREIAIGLGFKDYCWQANACLALQEGFEAYLVGLFEDCVLECIHGKRVTVMPKDMHVAMHIRGEWDKYAGSYKITQNPKSTEEDRPEMDITQEY